MENQFSDLTKPNIMDEYYCTPTFRSRMFTHLMKLVLVVRILIDAGADVNLENNCGYTALMFASKNSNIKSNVETVRILIDAGADVNANGGGKFTALMLASQESCENSNIETVRMLIDAGADVSFANNSFGSILTYLFTPFFGECNVDREV